MCCVIPCVEASNWPRTEGSADPEGPFTLRDPAEARGPGFDTYRIALALVLLGYIAVRVRAWQLSTRLEDHDSVSYLTNAILLRALDFERLARLGPDHNPFYPFFTALFSLPGWSTEFGARLCSLAFSLALFGALLGIGRRIVGPQYEPHRHWCLNNALALSCAARSAVTASTPRRIRCRTIDRPHARAYHQL
jgi:hypothetical protein